MRTPETPQSEPNPLKPVLFLADDCYIVVPPFTRQSRKTAGRLLRQIQEGETLPPRQSAPMFAAIGRGCYELRISHDTRIWRVMIYVADLHIVVLHSFEKKTQKTPAAVLNLCIRRRTEYLADLKKGRY